MAANGGLNATVRAADGWNIRRFLENGCPPDSFSSKTDGAPAKITAVWVKSVADRGKSVTDLTQKATDLIPIMTDLTQIDAELTQTVTDLTRSVTDLIQKVTDFPRSEVRFRIFLTGQRMKMKHSGTRRKGFEPRRRKETKR
jgi:hypothetical protein